MSILWYNFIIISYKELNMCNTSYKTLIFLSFNYFFSINNICSFLERFYLAISFANKNNLEVEKIFIGYPKYKKTFNILKEFLNKNIDEPYNLITSNEDFVLLNYRFEDILNRCNKIYFIDNNNLSNHNLFIT